MSLLDGGVRVGHDGRVVPLRRKTGRILVALLAVSLVPAIAGAVWTTIHAPTERFLGALMAPLLLLLVRPFCDGSWLLAAIVTLLLEIFGLAAACLHRLYGVPKPAAALVVLAAIALMGAILVRALIASGSADYPYDD